MKKLIIFLTSLILSVSLAGCSKNNSKIHIIEYSEFWTDIEVYVFCDYSKHKEYNNWIKEYNLKDNYNSSKEKYLDDYYRLLNNACYETLDNKFLNGEFELINSKECLYFIYSSEEFLNNDYKEIKKLSKEKYVTEIIIQKIGFKIYLPQI